MNPDLDRQPRQNPAPWIYPGDTDLMKARRLTWAYRNLAKLANPDGCRALDEAATTYGQGWVCEQPITVPDDQMLTTAQAAELAGVEVETVRQWRKRGYISRTGQRAHLQVKGLSERGWPMFLASDVLEVAATTRQTRLRR